MGRCVTSPLWASAELLAKVGIMIPFCRLCGDWCSQRSTQQVLGKASPLGQPNKLALMGTLGIPPREMAAVSKQEVSLSQTEEKHLWWYHKRSRRSGEREVTGLRNPCKPLGGWPHGQVPRRQPGLSTGLKEFVGKDLKTSSLRTQASFIFPQSTHFALCPTGFGKTKPLFRPKAGNPGTDFSSEGKFSNQLGSRKDSNGKLAITRYNQASIKVHTELTAPVGL